MKRIRQIAISVVALCLFGLIGTALQAQENRRVRIINRASSSIQYLYASNVDRRSWEEDILGAWRVIAPGYYRDVNIDDGSGHCLFDIKAVLSDGREAVGRNINVCTSTSWTVYDR